MQLLIATRNPSKLEMFKNLLKDFKNIELLSLSDFEKVEEPLEDGKTVEENAFIKAKYYSEKFNITTLADDAGFEIEDLGGKPGVKARRWGGELLNSVTDDEFIEFYLSKVKDIKKEKFKGRFPFARCLYLSENKYFFQNESIDLYLTKEPKRPYRKGWPMSSVNIMPDGRHFLDVPVDDPALLERLKKEGLIELINNLF